MEKLLINGGQKLSGTIAVAGAKNAVLPLIAASLLTESKCRLINVPKILDVEIFIEILQGLGCEVKTRDRVLEIVSKDLKSCIPKKELVQSMRASVVFMGALLGRLKKAEVAFPGGDKIGKRPINLHLKAFTELGAKIEAGEIVRLSAEKLRGGEVFAESSVTGTENMILASVLAEGTTNIKLAALEPHVQLLCDFLNEMGAKIEGVGTHTLKIRGVTELHGAEIEVIPDMIEAGTFAILAAASKSEIEITNVDHSHLDAVYEKFAEIGVNFDKSGNHLIIREPLKPYQAVNIRTGVYPSLATDLQPPFGLLLTQCTGKSIIHDWIYEGRLGYLNELSKMGAKVKIIDAHQAEITGPTELTPAIINSLDIRSGMTLVIASLIAKGVSEISGIHHIDRGYENLEQRLSALGADIKRVK